MKTRYYFTIAKLVFIVLVPIILFILPATYFDTGTSICLSKILFDFECYACGMTRACMHLIHFDFEEAYAYNMLSFVVFPILAIVWAGWFFKEWKKFKHYRVAFAANKSTN